MSDANLTALLTTLANAIEKRDRAKADLPAAIAEIDATLAELNKLEPDMFSDSSSPGILFGHDALRAVQLSRRVKSRPFTQPTGTVSLESYAKMRKTTTTNLMAAYNSNRLTDTAIYPGRWVDVEEADKQLASGIRDCELRRACLEAIRTRTKPMSSLHEPKLVKATANAAAGPG